MRRLKPIGLILLAVAIILWLAACALLLANRASLIYPFRPGVDASRVVGIPGARAVTIRATDGSQLITWVVPPTRTDVVVLFFMGNAGHLPANGARIAELVHQGHGVVALNYRGAGGAEGEPSERVLKADAITLYDQLDALIGQTVPAAHRIVYGTSLGAAVAVQLAANRPSAGVILGAPFAQLCETGAYHYPLIPVCWILPDNRWNSIGVIGQINAPLLVLHGAQDTVIPISQAERLFAAASEPKSFIRYPEGRHSDLRLYGSGIAVNDWIDRVILKTE
ncbi:MAG: alpha/beta fold hydrolase [Pseudomonadota bacterium]